MKDNDKNIHLLLLIGAIAILVWSGIHPAERFTWFMEVLPVLIGGGLLVGKYRSFRFTTLSYVLALSFSIVLMVGGRWTYAEVPIGFWVRDALDLSRNHFDRFGHFLQGFVPAIIARELLLRTSPLRQGKWLFAIVTAICLAISAAYEIFEWAYAISFGEGAKSFLGTQGDVWDTQWDMFLCLCGAILAQLILSRFHDRAIRKLIGPTVS